MDKAHLNCDQSLLTSFKHLTVSNIMAKLVLTSQFQATTLKTPLTS